MTSRLQFTPLPLAAVKPWGWLLRQLRIQADGLSGHLDEFWPSIKDSRWIGGDSEGWERVPYWLDGLIPLAFLLDDDRLQQKARRWVDYILDHQHPDGWLGDKGDPHNGADESQLDPWPQFVLHKALAQWQEATGDPRIIPAMQRSLLRIFRLLQERPLDSWAKMRWPDLVFCIHWLYQRAPEPWLLDLARLAAMQGYDWHGHFADFVYTQKQPKWTLENHVVNHAMALKEPAVRAALLGMETGTARELLDQYIATLDRWHGQVTWVFTGDESLAGLSPSQGTELCAVVEYLFSLEVAFGTLGEAGIGLGDRWERIAYNALPATFMPDMCAHQYVQQANQVAVGVFEDRVYTNNGPDANVFGLEPNFGCCTANMHQGWPKFVQHLWMRTDDGGLVALGYSPAQITAEVSGGKSVTVETETEYPFRETVRLRLRMDGSAQFPLYLRIPEWCPNATVFIKEGAPEPAPAGTLHKLDRVWTDGDVIDLLLPMTIKLETGRGGGVAITRGPLVFSLEIGEAFSVLKGEAPFCDYAVSATTPWNYAIFVDDRSTEPFVVSEHPVGAQPFAPGDAPVRIIATGCRLPEWGIEHNAAAPLSTLPQPVNPAEIIPEQITLLPYGSTHLRITEFPLWKAPDGSSG